MSFLVYRPTGQLRHSIPRHPPESLSFVAPMLAAVPMQLLAYEIAVRRGRDVDQPRNLSKSVAVE